MDDKPTIARVQPRRGRPLTAPGATRNVGGRPKIFTDGRRAIHLPEALSNEITTAAIIRGESRHALVAKAIEALKVQEGDLFLVPLLQRAASSAMGQ